jgi:type IV secretion system protein VirD4
VDPPGQASKAHGNEEAKALIAGPILFRVAHEDVSREHGGTVPGYLTPPPERFQELPSSCRIAVGPMG